MDDLSEFARCWPLLKAAIDKDIGGAVYTREEIWQAIVDGEAHLWTAEHSACIVEVVERLDGMYLNMFVVGAERGYLTEAMKVLWPQVEDWGRQNGFKAIFGSGRDVWGRILRNHGFSPVMTTFQKEL